MIIPFRDKTPKVANDAFIAPNVWIVGDVSIGSESSVYFGSVLRGDILQIRVGEKSNIQEHSMLHTTDGRTPTIVGDEVTVGHRAIVHGCSIEDRALIGMGAVVLDGAIVGEESIVAAGAVVLEGTKIPPRSLAVGIPAKVVKKLDDSDAERLRLSAAGYVERSKHYVDLFTKLP